MFNRKNVIMEIERSYSSSVLLTQIIINLIKQSIFLYTILCLYICLYYVYIIHTQNFFIQKNIFDKNNGYSVR